MLLKSSDDLEPFLKERAGGYDPAFVDGFDLKILREIRRGTSVLWLMDLTAGETSLPLVVKQRFAPANPKPNPWRLAPLPEPADMTACEARALQGIEALFAQEGPCHSALHVYEALPEEDILVMSRATGTELGDSLLRMKDPEALIQACAQAGAWLRCFHAGDVSPDAVSVSAVERFSGMRVLIDKLPEQPPQWDRLVEELTQADDEPAAIAHGDFWPGNVLHDAARITVLDTFAFARTSIYVDLAYFVVHLRAMQPQLYFGVRGEGFLSRCERAFLQAYDPGGTLSPAAFNRMCLRVLYSKWGGYREALWFRGGAKKKLQWAIRKRRLARLISAYAQEL